MSLIKDASVAVITGTSSNLGINVAYRLLESVPSEENLTIVVTSRTLPKVKEVIKDIQDYNAKNTQRKGDLEFDYLLVDFTDMVSILSAYYELTKRYRKINYFFVNAAQGVYDGIDWIGAVKQICTNPIEGVTHPTYKLQRVGVKSADGLGLMFQANVFGPYYLIHRLTPLLKAGHGKVVWISSVMSNPKYLSFEDLQLLRSPDPYEGSKRLVDLMHMGTYKRLKAEGITQYLVQPGIFTSFSFFQFLNVFTYYGMMMLFYIARWLGSPIHNISGYIAANAPIKCVTETQPQDQKVGSACDRWGKEYLMVQDVDATGAEDVAAYLDKLCAQWDETLKDQIVHSRKH
ncbi:hypothetical protein DIURU_004553 [Diutina rugosa]|uniref:3beta-hydroxysteroid 3-dehydrogenase n=1 Tax=Diutina rugosa TaxID=5481 RepID=A0A642UJ26_DIURU|nr:uncharacterized protein DIURU_004553 [Diutina rugosa]KAA8898709.1 hypothetical protein DIURU_004553 [Diutina rugosa]